MSASNNEKGAQAEDSKEPQPESEKPKLIRLDDLIPNKSVRGGRQFFGASDTTTTNQIERNS